jgi:hypothetical protein
MLTRLVLALASVTALALAARAQSLVQIAFSGSVATPGGARVEVDLGFGFVDSAGTQGESRLELGFHLVQNTSASELAQLLERELRRRGGFVAAAFESRGGEPSVSRASVFIERVSFVGLRLGRGLSAQVCLCESPPALVRFQSALERKEPARFVLSATTEHPHSKDRTRFEVAVDFTAAQTGAVAADTLTTASTAKGWSGSWLGHEAWQPEKLQTGARVTGACLELTSAGDWRIEIEVPRREHAR